MRVFVAMAGLAFVATAASAQLAIQRPTEKLAVLPLQAAVWVVRGLLLPFIDLAALAAYSAVLRRRLAASPPESSGPSSSPSSFRGPAAEAPIPLAATGPPPRPRASR